MNQKVKIFKAEKEAGLAEQLRASSSIAYVTQLQPLDPATPFAQKLVRAVASQEHPSETLYPMKDVLVTTGWNLNTDVFDNGETWVARNTPVHHPLNFEHDEKRIIGNITASQAVDDGMIPIGDELAIDELPSKFHILNGSVIYRVWQDKEQQELIENTIAEIEKGEWYVSMECVFKGFDYAVIRPDGSTGVITRNEDSAFLTKHLRHYGGSGVYASGGSSQEFKLGRVLRNINFIGKGLVRRPANPESVILNHVSAFVSSYADLGYIKSEAEVTSIKKTETVNMSEQNVDIKRLEDRVAELVKDKEALTTQLKDKDGEAAQATINGLKADLTSRDEQIAKLKTSKDELTKAVEDLTKRAETAESAKSQVEEELVTLKAEKVEKARLELLVGKGASQDKAKELVNKFSKYSDDEFNTIVETLSAAWKGATQPRTPTQVLQSVRTDKPEPSLAAHQGPEDTVHERATSTAKFIGGFLRYSKPANQE